MHPESVDLQHRWPLVNGFGLEPGDRCLVAGAYRGKVCRLLKDLYDCGGVGFEPQRWAYRDAVQHMLDYDDWAILPYGLGVPDDLVGELPLGEFHTDACGFNRIGQREQGSGLFLDASQILMSVFPPGERIALFVCNMEGFEYHLLPYLALSGWLSQMDRLALQFHRDLGNDEAHDQLQDALRFEGFRLIVDNKDWQYWVAQDISNGERSIYPDDWAKGP